MTTSIGAQVANFERQAGSTLIPALTKLQSGLATGIGTINDVLARVPGASTAAAGAIATGIGYLGWKTAQQGLARGMGLIGSGGAAGEGAAAGAAATGMSEGTAVAIGSAAGTTAAALAMTAAGVAVMGGTVYGLRQIGPSGLSRGRSEPQSQQDTDLPGHWAYGRFGLRQWALDQPGASPGFASQPGLQTQPVQPGLSTAEVQAIVAPLASAMAQAIGTGPRAEFRAQPVPFGPTRLDGPVTNQNTVNQTINAPITINATVNNSTPQAVGAAAASAVRRVAQRASTAVLHDGYETK